MIRKLTVLTVIAFMLLCVLPGTQPANAARDIYGYVLPFTPDVPAVESDARKFRGWFGHITRFTSDPEDTQDTWVRASWSVGWIMPFQKCIGVECNTDGATMTIKMIWYSNHDYSDAVNPPDCSGWASVFDSLLREEWEDKDTPPTADYKITLTFDQLGHGVLPDPFDNVEYTKVVLKVQHLLTGVVVTYRFPPDWLPPDCE